MCTWSMRAKQNHENDYNHHTTSALSLKVELTSKCLRLSNYFFQKVNVYEEGCTYLCLLCRG